MKTLIYSTAFGDKYIELAKLSMHSLRLQGYKGDSILFTNQDTICGHCEIINIDKHPDKELLAFEKTKMLKWIDQRGRPKYDYFKLEYLPGNFVDKNKYDYIMYCDADVLFRSPLDDIFEHDFIVTDYHGSTVYERTEELQCHFTEPELAQKSPALSSAVIGVPRKYYNFYDIFKNYYLKYLNDTLHDETTFNLCLFEHREEFKAQAMPRRKYWRHYWGNFENKSVMISDYSKLINGLDSVATR